MKKNLKKSLSLFLAVLMLMSCWVWVAPQKAEAAAPTNYTLEMNFTVSDACNGGTVKADVTHVANNGTGSATTTTWNLDKCESDTGTYSLTKDFSGFPTKIVWTVDQGGARTQEIKLNYFKINGTTILQGGWTLKPGWWSDASKTMEKSGEVVGGDQGTPTVNSWPTPKLESASVSLDPTSHTLARINSGTNSTSTITLSGHKDQYGVNWTGPITNTFTLRTDGDVNVGSSASSSGSGNSRTITITPLFQTYFPAKQNAKLYIDWTTAGGSGKKTGTETITIDFPTYMATFYANGGKIGVDDTEAKDSIEYTGEKMNIGSPIGKAPAYAAKDGFEFKGFYSTKYDDATGKTASFDENKKFKDSDDDNPTTVPNTGDTKWYAAWQALPITATFMTADNQLIGTVEGRYNNYLTATNMYNGDAGLNAAVKEAYTGSTVKFNGNNEPIYKDGATSYTFAGWKIIKAYDESVMDKNEDTVLKGDVTFQAVYTKADAQTYTVSFEDGNGNVLLTQDGYNYRDDVTIPTEEPTKAQDDKYAYEFIGWAKDIGNNFYTVDANDQDENGATIVYTHKDGASFIVKGNATYVPVFRMINREYNVTYNYTLDGGNKTTVVVGGYHWGDSPNMPAEIKDNYTNNGYRYYITGWTIKNQSGSHKLSDIEINGDIEITAVYGKSEAAKYTINFYGKDETGEKDVLLNEGANIYEHDSKVTAPTVLQIIDTEEALYTFAGWSPTVKSVASGDADYYATYTKQTYADIHFYNYDGTLLSETAGKGNNHFIGGTIPAYIGETPVKEEDPTGTYEFTGWADSQGNKVVPGTDTFTGDTYLYAQFETVYKNYTVKFMNGDEEVSTDTYHYGEEITIPDDPTKADDVQYTYEFKSWTPDVSKVCYGDATYEATYRRGYQTYNVTWFPAVESEEAIIRSYRYDQTIQQPSITLPGDAAPGYEWVVDYWAECDANGTKKTGADGKDVQFVRGRKMTAEALYFTPELKQVESVYTVTFYDEDGTTKLGTAEIPYNGNLNDYAGDFAAKAGIKEANSTYHYIVDTWVENINGGEKVETITRDIDVKLTYTAIEHNKVFYELVAAPTCNVPGFANYKCEADECTLVDYNRAIAPITDNGAPTGQILVGLTNKWTLEDYGKIDYTDVKFIGPKTTLIVNANDLGTHNWSLEAGEYYTDDAADAAVRGVGKIEYYVSVGTTNPATVKDGDWTEIYNYEDLRQEVLNAVLEENKLTLVDYNGYGPRSVEKAEIDRAVDAYLSVYKANATGIVSNLNLENGKSYVIYIKVSDREGNGEVNTSIFSTGTLKYGDKAAEIEVTGEGYGSKFCKEANIRIVDDADKLTITIDGKKVEAYTNPGTTSANGTFVASFKTTEKGIHTVEVTDKNGNKTVKTFEIKGDHTYRNYTIAATCETAGSRYDLCTVCGNKANEEVVPALGHNFKNFVDKAPDCLNDGYRTYVCDNNCGTKLVVRFDKDTNSWTNLEAAKITAKDVEHLKSKGEHTYAKVQDENGEDTAEDAWIIDKAPTCKDPGSKHKDCTICGALGRVTEDIPKDAETGHKFYREKVTKEPTCTAQGEKTKTCRYCGEEELVEYVDALGHTDGEYRVITPATCEAAGSQILTCATCGVDMGTAVEISALGHAWKAVGDPVKKDDGKYYQHYVCKNDSKHTKDEVTEHEEKIPATVTFKNGDVAHATISGFVGDTITAAEITKVPTKEADTTYTYTFSHWEDADGKVAKFPIEVKKDATYTAVFAEKYINYTITYYKEDGTEFKKKGYLHNGEVVSLDKNGPAKAETNLVKYEFAGWENINDANADYSEYKVTINGANINLKAKYTEKKKLYGVTYAYSSSNQLESFNVFAGEKARDCAIIPEKASDTKYHYEFKGWNKKAQLANVVSNIYTTPDFEAVLHDYEVTEKTPAACGVNQVVTKACDCGYSYDVEVANTALEHIWGDPKYNEETGKNVVTCTREGCGYSEADTRTFTAKFYVNAGDTTALKNVSYIPWGTVIDSSKLPAAPSKESTDTTDYTFKGWALKNDATEEIIDFTTYVVKADCEFVAVFEATTRLYSVVFAYDATRVIKTYPDVEAGSSVKYDGIIPVQEYDVNYHYKFSNWKGYDKEDGLAITVSNIQSNIYITAEFSKTKHSFTSTELSQATCTSGAGIKYECTCGYNYNITGKPLDHKYPADYVYENGEYVRYCEYGCGTKDVKEQPGDSGDNGGNSGGNTGDNSGSGGSTETKKHVLTVYVYENGNRNKPIANATVDIYKDRVWYAKEKTGTDGKVQFVVEDGTYAIDISDIPYQKFYRDENVSVTGDKSVDASITVKACTCACHSTSLWGSIFRFFHKIIKLFTGEFKCCADPSNY